MLDVLLVEDSPTEAAAVSARLRRRGYTVTVAMNATEALSAAKSARYRIVVTDLHLGTESGADLIAQLRKTSDRFTPIIALTGDADAVRPKGCDVLLDKAKEHGFLLLGAIPSLLMGLRVPGR